MSKLIMVFLCSIAFCLIYTAPGDTKIDPKAAAGIWLLDDDDDVVEDISGNENHGVLQGDPEWVDGKLGLGLSLNGLNQRVVIPDSDSLDHHRLGICKQNRDRLWAYPGQKE